MALCVKGKRDKTQGLRTSETQTLGTTSLQNATILEQQLKVCAPVGLNPTSAAALLSGLRQVRSPL